MENSRIVYITNRGGTHPNRLTYMDAVQADYQLVDFILPWHGKSTSKLRILISGLLCALFFPKSKNYNLYISSDLQLPVVLMRVLGLISKKQKVFGYMGSQTLYFMYSKYFSTKTIKYNLWLMQHYDGFICNGDVQARLIKKLLPGYSGKIYVNENGVSTAKRRVLENLIYQPSSNKIVTVGNFYSEWRLYYKGIDVLLISFDTLIKKNFELELHIYGEYNSTMYDWIRKNCSEKTQTKIFTHGSFDSLDKVYDRALLYVHCSRGDALPNAMIEAMVAGIPVVTSEWTGNYDKVKNINSQLVCAIESDSLTKSIEYFLGLSEVKKLEIHEQFKAATIDLTESKAIETFKDIIQTIQKECA